MAHMRNRYVQTENMFYMMQSKDTNYHYLQDAEEMSW